MKRLSILALFVFATTMASFAQSTGGKLVVIQDDEVERLLKSKRTELAATRAQGNADEENTTRTETSSAQTSTRRNTPRRRFNSAGFRIQIFTGGKSRALTSRLPFRHNKNAVQHFLNWQRTSTSYLPTGYAVLATSQNVKMHNDMCRGFADADWKHASYAQTSSFLNSPILWLNKKNLLSQRKSASSS